MAFTYDNINRPYSSQMTRSERVSSDGNGSGGGTSQDEGWRTIKSGSSLNDAWIDTWIKSTWYIPKKRGFMLDGQAGYIECMKLWVGGGGIVGGYLDIPDNVTVNSFHVDALGNTWWGSVLIGDSVASILNSGAGSFSNITITGGCIWGVSVTNVGAGSNPTADIVPTGLACSSTTANVASDWSVSSSVVLTWTTISSATFDHYIIRYKKGTYTYYTYLTANTNTITIEWLTPAVSYNFGIASVNKFGISSAFSVDISQTTATSTTPPATVVAGVATAWIQSVVVTWTANTESDLASYNVYRKTTNDSSTSILWANIRTNYFVDSGMAGGQVYYYWIKAINTSGLLSAAYSTEVHATPRNIITNDIGANQITAPLTSLAAINSVTGNLNENTVGTSELQDNAVYEANVLAGAISAAKTNIAAINAVSGDLNSNTVGTAQLTDNAVGSQESNIALRGWEQTCVFTATDADTVTWGAGTFTASNGDSYSILTGNTGNMTAKTYIYLNIAVSTTAYQTTTTATTAVGDGKVLIAIAQNNTTEAIFMLLNNNSYNIDAANIVAGSITANEIQAGAVIASKITSYNFQVSAGTFTNNSPTAGKIAWTGCKVVYAGTEYSITNGSCLTTDKHIYWQLAAPTVFSASATLPALGNDDFLVAFNNSGTTLLVWNSTIINGNRITTGSVTATQISAHSITANEIAAGTITATEIAAGTITANKITSYNFVLSAWSFTNNSPDAGKLAWTGCKVVYNGTEYSITNGSCLTTDKHVYWQLATPTVFSANATLPSLGNDDFIVVFNNWWTALYVWNSTIINGNRITAGSITATNMAANTITANEIAAGTVTADRINSNSFAFSAITFTADTPVAGKISWTGCKVVYKGTEYSITNGNCETTDKHIYWQLASPTVFSASATLPALGNDDFLVVFNDAGTPKYVWNSTIINGNRISTGSIYTGQIATGTILGSNIANGTIASSNVLSINADKILIDGVATFLNTWFSYKGIYDAGTVYSYGDQVSYLTNLWNYINTTPGAGHTPAENTYWTTGGASQITTIDGGVITTGTVTTSQLNFTPVASTNVIASINASAEDAGLKINANRITITGSTTFLSEASALWVPHVFYTTPTTPYRVGDLWVDGTVFKKCITELLTGAYNAAHWGLATAYEDNGGVTSIIGGTVNAAFVNALNVNAATINASVSIATPVITGGSIAIGTANSIFKADANGIYLGNATFASAPFQVDMHGNAKVKSLARDDFHWFTLFESVDWYYMSNDWTGTITVGNTGLIIISWSSNWNISTMNKVLSWATWDKDKKFKTYASFSSDTQQTIYIVNWSITPTTDRHFWFRILDNQIRWTCADWTTQNMVVLATLSIWNYILEAINDIVHGEIRFYINWSYAGNLTSNIPTWNTDSDYIFTTSVESGGAAITVNIWWYDFWQAI